MGILFPRFRSLSRTFSRSLAVLTLCAGLVAFQAAVVSSHGPGEKFGKTLAPHSEGAVPSAPLADLTGVTHSVEALRGLLHRQEGFFSLSSDVAGVTVEPGQSAGFTLAARSNTKVTYKLDLKTQGLPIGVTASFLPTTLVTNTGTSRLTVTAGAGTAPGTYRFEVVGSTVVDGTQVAETLSLGLVVRGGTQDFNLSANPTAVSILAGQTASYTITSAGVSGFTGPLTFSSSGLPPGSTAVFTPASVATGGAVRFTVTTSLALAPQTYPLTVTGTAAINGQPVAHSLSLMLEIHRQEDFGLTVIPTTIRIAPGQVGSLKVLTTSAGGFQEKITFSTSGLPAGVKAGFVAPDAQAGQGTELRLQVPSDLPQRAYSFMVAGTAVSKGQTISHSIPVTLEVRRDETPDYLLLVAPEAPVLKPGGKVVFTIEARTIAGYQSPIQLSVSNLPKGLNDTIQNRTILPGGRTTLTLQAATGIPSGRFTFLVDGNLDVPGETVVRRRTPVTLVIGGAGSSTNLSGVVMTAEANSVPIPNVTVSPVSNPSIQVRTDAQGRFTLNGIPPVTHQIITIDGHTADTASTTFPVIPLGVDVVPYTGNKVGWTIYLPKIDTANNVPIIQNAAQDQIITTPRIPNMKVVIPAHTTLINQDGSPVPQISITPLPSNKMPMPYPEGLDISLIPQIYTIQPGGAVASKPVQVFYPNLSHVPANQPVVFWGEDHDLGTFRIFGTGTPSPDGLQIIPDNDPNFPGLKFGLSRFSWHYFAPPCGANSPPPPNAPTIFSLRMEPNPMQLEVGKEVQARVYALLTDGVELDVTSLCSFSSTLPEVASVTATGLVTAAANTPSQEDCASTLITAKLETAPPGVRCDPAPGGGGRPAQASASVHINNGLQVRVLSDYDPLPANGEKVVVLNTHPVSLALSFKQGGGHVKVTEVETGQIIFDEDIPENMVAEIPLNLLQQTTKFKFAAGCQEETRTIYLVPNAELTVMPYPVPISAVDPQGFVTTLADAQLSAVFDLDTFSPPVKSVEFQIRKGGQIIQIIGPCHQGEPCQGFWPSGQKVNVSALADYEAVVVYKLDFTPEDNIDDIVAARKGLFVDTGKIIQDYRSEVTVRTETDSGGSCTMAQDFYVRLRVPAHLTIGVRILGEVMVYHEADHPAGDFFLAPPTLMPSTYPFVITAAANGESESVTGQLEVTSISNRSLPLGHTFVNGVDLADGHLVHSVTDFRIPGKGLSLELSRTYSNSGIVTSSPFGAGWSDNYHSRLIALNLGTCVDLLIIGGEGQGVRFRNGSPTPLEGFTGTLTPESGGYVYRTKTGIEYHYGPPIVMNPMAREFPTSPANLLFIEDPNGNRLTFEYDGERKLKAVVDASNRRLTFSYAQAGGFQRVAYVDGPGGLGVRYSYDANGNLRKVERSTRIWQYDYSIGPDPRVIHRLTRITNPNGFTTSYDYYQDSDIIPGEGLTPPGCNFFQGNCTVLMVGDKLQRVKRINEPAATIGVTFDFSQFATPGPYIGTHLTIIQDGNNNQTAYVIGQNGETREIRQPQGVTTTLEWSGVDKVAEVDGNGRRTVFGYDTNHNLTSEDIAATDPDTGQITHVVTTYSYDPDFSRLTSKTDPVGTWLYEIDSTNGNLMSVRDPAFNRTTYLYNPDGTLRQKTDQRNFVTTYEYNGPGGQYGNPTTIRQQVGANSFITTTHEYDDRSRMLLAQVSTGLNTAYGYDEFDQVMLITSSDVNPNSSGTSASATTNLTYYAGGQIRTRTEGGIQSSYGLDTMDRVTSITQSGAGDTFVTLFGYDNNSNQTYVKDRRGVERFISFDGLNRPYQVRVQGPFGGPNNGTGMVSHMTYDNAGNKLTETDVRGNVTTFVYDGLYHLKRKIWPLQPFKEQYLYDGVGNLLRYTDANDAVTSYSYDGLSRVTNVTDGAGRSVQYEYMLGIATPTPTTIRNLTSGLVTVCEYDGLSRKTRQVVTVPAPPGGMGATYTSTWVYDDTAHRVTETDAKNIRHVMQLDGFERVAKVVLDEGNGKLNLTTSNQYDDRGNRIQVTQDASGLQRATGGGSGHVTSLTYNSNNQVRIVTYPTGISEQFDYDGEGLRTGHTDRTGIRTNFTYDNLGRPRQTTLEQSITTGLSCQTDPAPGQLRLSNTVYDDISPGSSTTTDANGRPVRQEFDKVGRVTRIVDGVGLSVERKRTITWDGVNRRSESDWYVGISQADFTSYSYDGANRLTQVTDPLGKSVRTVYTDNQNKVTVTDKAGVKQIRQLDALGRLATLTVRGTDNREILAAQNQYDAHSNLTRTVDAALNITTFSYDNGDRRRITTRGVGTLQASTVQADYDEFGNVLAVTNGHLSQSFGYDDLDRRLEARDGLGRRTQYSYDGEGRVKTVRDPYDYLFSYEYDELGALVQASYGNQVVVYRYDAMRNRRFEFRPDKKVERQYNILGQLRRYQEFAQEVCNSGGGNRVEPKQSSPLFTEDYERNVNGSVTRLTNSGGQEITFDYDALQQQILKRYPAVADQGFGPVVREFAYDYSPSNQLRTVTEQRVDGSSFTHSRTFDAFDRVASETDRFGKQVQFDYFDTGLRRKVTDPVGNDINYTYDPLNRLQTVTSPYGGASYQYFADDLVQQITVQAGGQTKATCGYNYDNAGRVTDVHNQTAGGQTLSRYQVAYQETPKVITLTETQNGQSEVQTFSFGTNNRLTRAQYSNYAVDYTYTDYTGQRQTETATGAVTYNRTYSYDPRGRLERVFESNTLTTTTLGYDADGNVTSKAVEVNGGAAQTTQFTYDIRDTLRKVVNPAGQTVGLYEYDYAGRRIRQEAGGQVTKTTYDGDGILAEWDNALAPQANFVWGNGDMLCRSEAGPTRTNLSYLWNNLGSTANVLNTDTNIVVQSLRYDAWGQLRGNQPLAGSANRHTFTQQRFDEETGMYSMGNGTRFYDPALGAFMAPDQLQNAADPRTLSPYSYAFSNPIEFKDPSGLAAQNPQNPSRVPDFVDLEPSRQRAEETSGESVTVRLLGQDDDYLQPTYTKGSKGLVLQEGNDPQPRPSNHRPTNTSGYRPLLNRPTSGLPQPTAGAAPRYRGNDNYIPEKPTGIKWLDDLNARLNGYLDFLETHSYGIVSRARARGFINGFEDAERSFLTSLVNGVTHPLDTFIINPLNRIGQNYYDAYFILNDPGDFLNALVEGGRALPSQDLNYRLGYVAGEQAGNYVITTAAVGSVVRPFAGGGGFTTIFSDGVPATTVPQGANNFYQGPDQPAFSNTLPYNPEEFGRLVFGQSTADTCVPTSCRTVVNNPNLPESVFRQGFEYQSGYKPGDGYDITMAPTVLGRVGVEAELVKQGFTPQQMAIATVEKPAIVGIATENTGFKQHAVVVDGVLPSGVLVRDPLPVSTGSAYKVPLNDFQKAMTGAAVILKR
ncbi:MAG: hypothetical protein K1Y36_22330 [Blastocatellia bacterium]|nr:hypothetical protein [Blastocatellia bacterium]